MNTTPPCLDEALRLIGLGYSVLPINPVDKKPLADLVPNGVKNATKNETVVRTWWHARPDANLAVETTRCCVVDIDPCDGKPNEWLSTLDEPLVTNMTSTTPRGGSHLWFADPTGVLKNSASKLAPNVDTRATNGYVLVAPSIVNGHPYQWTTGPVPFDKLPFAPEWLVTKLTQPKRRKNSSTNCSPRQATQRDNIVDRARKYLMAMGPAIAANGGGSKTFLAAQHLVRGFMLSDSEAFDLMSDWNRDCEPPWTDNELRHKIQSARSDGDTVAIGEHMQTPSDQRYNGSVGLSENDDGTPRRSDDKGDSWTDIKADQGRTELANARRFAATFGEDVRFCHAWRTWLTWDGTRWKIDDDGAVQRMGTNVADSLWYEVAKYHTKDSIEFAGKTSKASGINAMLKLAASMRPICVDKLDANHWLLNCPNGTVDLRTGELGPYRREDNITKLCPTNFNADAETYSFDHFLDGVFGGNATLIGFLQRLFGYCLTGDVREQCLPVFHGSGANGKSTLLTAIQDALGIDYSTTAPPSLLMEKKTPAHPTELAGLFGKRLVVAQETNQGARLAESTVKQLTGGDRVSARLMREDFWEFNPTHKLILCTNHKPRVKGTDHAIWRRLLLIPFANKFWNPAKGESGPDELRQDKGLPAKLKAEAEGILAWMVQGCLAWQRDGLQVPDIVRAATEVYRSASDIVGRFVTECCLTIPSERVKFSVLYLALESWCEDAGDSVPSRRFVGEWLRDAEFRDHSNNGRWYLGIAIKTETAT